MSNLPVSNREKKCKQSETYSGVALIARQSNLVLEEVKSTEKFVSTFVYTIRDILFRVNTLYNHPAKNVDTKIKNSQFCESIGTLIGKIDHYVTQKRKQNCLIVDGDIKFLQNKLDRLTSIDIIEELLTHKITQMRSEPLLETRSLLDIFPQQKFEYMH